MNRCLDCNSLMHKSDTVCIDCGARVPIRKLGAAGVLSTLLAVAFYLSLVALGAALFLPEGPSVIKCVLLTVALLFLKRLAKESSVMTRH